MLVGAVVARAAQIHRARRGAKKDIVATGDAISEGPVFPRTRGGDNPGVGEWVVQEGEGPGNNPVGAWVYRLVAKDGEKPAHFDISPEFRQPNLRPEFGDIDTISVG